MGLEDYKKKRDFSRTPEPAGEERAPGGNSYCIQKHAASRLHYDFRLEWGGVLMSWAVPKGPSFDPRDKRLAMKVEDHPVEYGSFEGVIPEGEYGAGAVVLWDRGTWTPVIDPALSLKKGELKFVLHGGKLAGKWALVKIKGDDPKAWLLLKDKDEHARTSAELDIVSARPESVVSGRGLAEVAAERDRLWHSKAVAKDGTVDPGGPAEGKGGERLRLADLEGAVRGPMPRTQALALAMVVEAPPSGDEWLHEIKHDGYRIVARVEEGEVQLVSRNGKDWTKEFPQVARAVGRLPAGTALVDGEVAAVLPSGATSFQALQRRSEAVAPIVYFAFDLLHLDGWDLRNVKLVERKQVLRRLLESGPAALRFSDHVRGMGVEFFEQARAAGLEGVVSKRADAPYRDGRGGDWLKSKCRLSQEMVIGGWTPSSDNRGSIGALLVGFHEGDDLAYAGKVGSGFNDRLLADLQHRLDARKRTTSPFADVPPEHRKSVTWVEPDLVAQVEFTEWTDEGRMRQPVFLGLRDDRDPRHVVRERPGMVEGGGVDTVAAGRPWEALRAHATRTHSASGEEVVELLGVRLTHPDRIYYPGLGFTKLDLALYYVSIADAVLPQLEGRPLTLVRCPDGISGETFYQKHAGAWTPPQIRRFNLPGKSEEYLFVDSVPGFVALAQAGILEIHPWNSRVARLEQPDQVIFDLDPDEALPFSRVASGARRVRALLGELGLESFVKTTGGKGLHVCVPLQPEHEWEALGEFTRAVALRLERDEPAGFTANMGKAHRKGRIFVDYLRNVRGANAVGAYSTRAREGAPVSVPVDWDELDRLSGPKDFTVAEVPLRVLGAGTGRSADPWARYLELKQRVPASLLRALAVTAGLAVLLGSAGLASAGGEVAQAAAPSQAVGPRFKATTDLVQVDVGVFDEEGRPVRDLEASDFVVEEDGVAQTIEGFQSVAASVGAVSEPWLASRVSTNLGAKAANAPTLVVVFDDIHLSEMGAARARAAATRLLEGLGAGSQVGVVSTGGGIWSSGRIDRDREGLMSAVRRLKGQRLPELRGADQITDYEAMRIVQHNDTTVLRRVVDRWTRNSKLWEQTWGADTAPAGAAASTDVALRSPGGGASGDIRSALGSSSGETQAVQALATQAFETARQGRRRAYRSLLRILNALGASDGRKSVVFLSERFLNDPSDREFALVSTASRRANAPISVVDVGGLAASDLQADQRRIEDVGPTFEEQQEMRAGLAGIAAECGGFAITGTDDFAFGLEKLVTGSSHYYLLGYQPTNRVADRKFRRIRVSVRRSGVDVRARPGYVALPPEAEAGRGREDPARRMLEVADAPFALAGIELRMSAYTFETTRDETTRALLVSELRLDDLSFVETDGQFSAELDVLLTVTHFGTGRTLGDRPVGIKLAARSDVRGQNAWHRVTQEVQLLPGAWLAKIVVQDRRTGAVGSVTHSMDVPGGPGWRASSAVVSDALSADSGPEQRHALPLARRTFAAAGMLYAQLEVYDPILDESTGRPHISAGFVLVRSGGAIERRGALTPIEPLPDRRLTHFIALPLRGLKPGDYELVLRLEDKVTGRTRELHEPFSLRRPERPTLDFYRDLLLDYVEGRGEDAVATLVAWPTAAAASLAKRIDASEGMLTRVAAMLHTEAALALFASRETGAAPAHLEIARALLERTGPDSSFRRDWLLAVGFQLQARGDRASEALRFFLECQAAFPLAAEAPLAAGTVYEASAFPNGMGGNGVGSATGDLVEAAKRQYRAALAIDPLLAEAGLRLGRTLQLAGDREEALAQFRRVVDQDGGASTRALAHLFLGELLEQRGEAEEAARQFREALELDPTLQQAGLALAAILWREGDRTGSGEVLVRALSSACPVGPPSWLAYHLGQGVRAATAIDALRRAARS